MKMKMIVGIFVGVFVLFTVYRLIYSHFEEKGRHEFEDGEYCESFENTKHALYLNSEPNALFASFYARGLCVSQDIEKAKQIYQSKPQKDMSDLRTWLFYEGIEIAREDGRNNTPNRIEKIQPLFTEAKKLGYVTGEKENQEIQQRNLKQLFDEIVIKN